MDKSDLELKEMAETKSWIPKFSTYEVVVLKKNKKKKTFTLVIIDITNYVRVICREFFKYVTNVGKFTLELN